MRRTILKEALSGRYADGGQGFREEKGDRLFCALEKRR